MRSRKPVLVLLAVIVAQAGFAQQLQRFNGRYSNGTAQFTFHQSSTKDTIRDGAFQYLSANGQSERGQYTNNLKSGRWTYSYERNDYTVSFGGDYKNGQKDGTWTFDFLEDGQREKYGLTFRQDTLIGKVIWNGLQGEFDPHGRFINAWSVAEGSEIYTAAFKDNVLISLDQKSSLGLLYNRYRADTGGLDFANPSLRNPSLIRKEFDLDWNFRLMSGEFDVDHIYSVDDAPLPGTTTAAAAWNLFFSKFFMNVLDQLNDKISGYTNWDFFTEIRLKVNPEFLYLLTLAPRRKEHFVGPDSFKRRFPEAIDYSLADEKPFFQDGAPGFISMIMFEYYNSEIVDGHAEVELIIDPKGNAIPFTITTTGNISERELRRAIAAAPPWGPGKKSGKTVAVRMMLPISFSRRLR